MSMASSNATSSAASTRAASAPWPPTNQTAPTAGGDRGEQLGSSQTCGRDDEQDVSRQEQGRRKLLRAAGVQLVAQAVERLLGEELQLEQLGQPVGGQQRDRGCRDARDERDDASTPVLPAEADDDESGERHEPDPLGQHERCSGERRTRQRREGGEREKAERDRCRERHGRALAQPGRIREGTEREQRGDRQRAPSLDRAEPDRKRCEQARRQGRGEEEKRVEAGKHVERRADERRRRLHVRVLEAGEREVAKRSDGLRGRSQLGHVEDEVAERVRPVLRVGSVLEEPERDREPECPRERGCEGSPRSRVHLGPGGTRATPRQEHDRDQRDR